MKRREVLWVLAVCVWATVDALYAQAPLGTTFTYQGQLKQGGLPVTNTADFRFTLWDALVGGNPIGAMIPVDGKSVANGLFTVTLDFGPGAFAGEARWLEIAVRSPAGGGTFTTLVPRQELTAAPQALFAAAPWTIAGEGKLFYTSGNVGIGTTYPWFPLHVETTGELAIYGCSLGTSKDGRTNYTGVYGEGTTIGVRGVAYQSDTGEHFGMWGTAGTHGTNYGVRGEATGDGTNYGVQGMASGSTTGYVPEYGVWGQATGSRSNSYNYGVYGLARNAGDNYGLSGTADTAGAEENAGVCAAASGAAVNYGVHGNALGNDGTKYGVCGEARDSGVNYGVYGTASGGTTNWAGYFAGAVNATDGIVTGQGASGGGTRWGNIKVRASVTLATAYGATVLWDFQNRQVKLINTSAWEYCHFAGHKWEGGAPTFVYGYGAPSNTTVLATLDANGEYLVVDIASSAGRGHIHIYCYYDNLDIVANYTYRYD